MKKVLTTGALILGLLVSYSTKVGYACEVLKPSVTAGIVSELYVSLDDIETNSIDSKIKPVTENDLIYDESDIELLARLVTAEMGYNRPAVEYYYCGAVVLNRVNSVHFPNTIYEVIYQKDPLQYACTENGHIERDYDTVAYKVVTSLLEQNDTWIPDNVVYQDTKPHGSDVYEILGTTYFCYM